jgi:hypothetical protein
MKLPSLLCCVFLVAGLAPRVVGQPAVALEDGRSLRTLDLNPLPTGVVNSAVGPSLAITGLAVGEALVGLDYRPLNRTLVGVSDQNRIYVLNPATGGATLLSTMSLPLSGSTFGVDFNPVVDRLRVVSNTGQNLRINVDTGAVTADLPLDYRAGDSGAGRFARVLAVAYTNATASRLAASTVLYDIDSDRNFLVRQDPPDDGTLVSVGALGPGVQGTGAFVGFDIFSPHAAFAIKPSAGTVPGTEMYRIDLATGAATLHRFYANLLFADLAIVPKEPALGVINTSARGTVAQGEATLIAGFVVGGNAPLNVLVTTRGPSLGALGVTNPVPETRVEVFAGATRIDANSNWSTHPRAAEIAATGFGPTTTRESAAIVTLPPGAYTAVITSGGTTSGVGLVEVYELP